MKVDHYRPRAMPSWTPSASTARCAAQGQAGIESPSGAVLRLSPAILARNGIFAVSPSWPAMRFCMKRSRMVFIVTGCARPDGSLRGNT